MFPLLNRIEIRVLGSLIEKQITTADNYPLSLNALANGCNQLTNREPVVSYDEKTIAASLDTLREKKLVQMIISPDNRVPKYHQVFTEVCACSDRETAVMCILMLRGPQTIGEIRGRTGRLYDWAGLPEVEQTLNGLLEQETPLVVKLPRQPGTKESRFAHLLSGPVTIEEPATHPQCETAIGSVDGENERMTQLEKEVETLRQELSDLRQQFTDFRKQFE